MRVARSSAPTPPAVTSRYALANATASHLLSPITSTSASAAARSTAGSYGIAPPYGPVWGGCLSRRVYSAPAADLMSLKLLKLRYRLLSGLLAIVMVRVEMDHHRRALRLAHHPELVVDESDQLSLEHIEVVTEAPSAAPEAATVEGGPVGPGEPTRRPESTVSQLVPVYNEADLIPVVIPLALRNRARLGISEVLVVDSGSVDQTQAELEKLTADPNLRVVLVPARADLQRAIEVGAKVSFGTIVLVAHGDVVPFVRDIRPIVNAFRNEDIGIVIASRYVDELMRKTTLSKVASVLCRLAFRLRVEDIGSPLIAFRGSLIRDVVEKRARRSGHPLLRAFFRLASTGGRFVEIPLSECVAPTYNMQRSGKRLS